MGAINYGASYYFMGKDGKREFDKDITIGLKPTSDYDDDQSGYTEWLEAQKEFNDGFEEADDDRSEYDHEQDSFRVHSSAASARCRSTSSMSSRWASRRSWS